jgi:hypothetical protein
VNHRTVFFADNFFSSGQTDILTQDESKIGSLNLKSMFSSSVDILDETDQVLCSAKFKFFSNKWFILNAKEAEEVAAKFEKVSGFFSSAAFRLTNHSEQLYLAELVALVMGVNALQKRQNSRAANSGGTH